MPLAARDMETAPSHANRAVTAVDATARRRPLRQRPEPDDPEDLLHRTTDVAEVLRAVRHLDHAVPAPRVDDEPPTHRQAEVLADQQRVDRRLDPQRRVDPAG